MIFATYGHRFYLAPMDPAVGSPSGESWLYSHQRCDCFVVVSMCTHKTSPGGICPFPTCQHLGWAYRGDFFIGMGWMVSRSGESR